MKWFGGTLVFLAELAMLAGLFWWGYTNFDGYWSGSSASRSRSLCPSSGA